MMVPAWWAGAAEAVLAFLLTYALHSTVLLAVVALLTRVVRAAEWRDALWKAALVGGVATAAVASVPGTGLPAGGAAWALSEPALTREAAVGASGTALVEASGIALAEGSGIASADASGTASIEGSETGSGAPSVVPFVDATGTASVETSTTGSRVPPALAATARTFADDGGASSLDRELSSLRGRAPGAALATRIAMPALLLWLVVAAARVARLVLRRRALFALLADRRPVTSSAAAELFASAARATALRQRVRFTSSRACPLPVALTSREVCVPERFLTELDAEQQRGALAHEVAHLARRDPTWLLGLATLEAVFFFQPLNALGLRRAKEVAEYLCDDWAARAGAGLGLARCLETVASWIQPGHARLLAATSPMAERRCTLVRRVERLLATHGRHAPDARYATTGALALVLLVAGTAPAFTPAASAETVTADRADQVRPGSEDPARSGLVAAADRDDGHDARRATRQETIVRAPDPRAPLRERWNWALGEAASRRGTFWIVYAFDRPTPRNEQYLSDSEGISFSGVGIDISGLRGTPLRSVLGGGGEFDTGTIAVLLRFGGRSASSIDRIGHRSMTLSMDFDRQPVFWLGTAADGESVAWLETLLAQVRAEELQDEVVDALALHATSSVVLPALSRILERHDSERVRSEAAEGLEYHDVPASLALARAAATGDPSSLVRAEAAEAIGGILAPGAAAALEDLALGSDDAAVRREAAEALEDQPEAEALPALERVIFEAPDGETQSEAVEALAAFGAGALPLLRRTIWEHPVANTRVEATETLGDTESEQALPLLAEILERHPDEQVQEEALDVLADLDSPRARTMLLDAVTRSSASRTRQEAVELIAERGKEGSSLTTAEIEELADLLERVAFEDPDRAVREQAVESMADLPRDTALRLLRRVVETHPDAATRREAVDVLSDLRGAR
jgi:beta-lactamase regulating signal transducer with metallopeptidase domain/HEAT repeat protein